MSCQAFLAMPMSTPVKAHTAISDVDDGVARLPWPMATSEVLFAL
jgi:hypothetical protein